MAATLPSINAQPRQRELKNGAAMSASIVKTSNWLRVIRKYLEALVYPGGCLVGGDDDYEDDDQAKGKSI